LSNRNKNGTWTTGFNNFVGNAFFRKAMMPMRLNKGRIDDRFINDGLGHGITTNLMMRISDDFLI
jgi:uncharacterized protein YbcC (UPF0753/DUF2309 family)